MADLQSFHDSVKKGDLENVRGVLSTTPELLDGTNSAGQNAILLAKYYRQTDVADYLLSLHPKLDVFTACAAGKTELALAEIDLNPTIVESRSPDGWTPLHLAAFFGYPELAAALMDRGAQLEARSTNAMRNTPLHAAAPGGNVGVLKLLVQRGADPNARQQGGWTALHAAAQSGSREMVEALIAAGVDLSARADNNQSALDLALSSGHGEVAALIESLSSNL